MCLFLQIISEHTVEYTAGVLKTFASQHMSPKEQLSTLLFSNCHDEGKYYKVKEQRENTLHFSRRYATQLSFSL